MQNDNVKQGTITEDEQRAAIRAYWRSYRNRPEVIEKRRAYQREYMRRKRAEKKAAQTAEN